MSTKTSSKFLIGQPARYPNDLVTALKRLFAHHQGVQRAYIAQFFDPSQHQRPHLLVGLEVSEPWDQVLNEAGAIAQNTQTEDSPVDFITITGTGPIEDYFLKQAKPFFER